MPQVHRSIRLVGAVGAEIRTALFEEREHVVVPVVALVGDEVIFASNSPGPEFVPAAEIERTAHEWNGRPIVGDHPADNGRAVSANDPPVAEREAFGRIAHPRFENNRLLVDAWLDRAKAERIGTADRIRRAEAGEPIEVSVGAWVEVEEREGVAPNGKRYVGIWRDVSSDHLALLPEGAVGACDASMGCGAPRIARHLVTASGLELQPEQEKPMTETTKRTLRERLRALFAGDLLDLLRFRGAAEESVSDMDLRSSLDRALFAEEPGYLGIDAVFPSESTVVYAVAPEQKVTLYRRSYSLSDDGTVSLADTKEAVEPVTRYEPVTAEAAPTPSPQPAAASCGCQKPTNPSAESAKEEAMSKLAERVKALIANPRSPYVEADAEWLTHVPEERLQALEEAHVAPTTETPKPEPEKAKAEDDEDKPKVETVAIPADELAGLRRMAAKEQAREKARKNQLVSTLVGAQKRHSEAKLQAMSLDQLEDIAALLEVDAPAPVDYSGRGIPRAAAEGAGSYTPPDPYGLRKKAAISKEAN